jgi:hypothetical protein
MDRFIPMIHNLLLQEASFLSVPCCAPSFYQRYYRINYSICLQTKVTALCTYLKQSHFLIQNLLL